MPRTMYSASDRFSLPSFLPRQAALLMRPRTVLKLLVVVVSCVVLGLVLYEPHVELAFYSRQWVNAEVAAVGSLAGCFDPARVSPDYNVTRYVHGPKTTELHAGLSMRFGMDCYQFAATIPSPLPPPVGSDRGLPRDRRTHFHTYWRVDLAPFEERQEQMLKSFFATQNTHTSLLVLWSNGDLSSNPILQRYLRRFPHAFELRVADVKDLAAGTALEGSPLLDVSDGKAWIDGDLVRLLVVWHHGGVWVDMDSLLTRNLDPLLEHEFVTQWDCYGGHSVSCRLVRLTGPPQTNRTSRSTALSSAFTNTRPTSVRPSISWLLRPRPDEIQRTGVPCSI